MIRLAVFEFGLKVESSFSELGLGLRLALKRLSWLERLRKVGIIKLSKGIVTKFSIFGLIFWGINNYLSFYHLS